MKKLLSALTGLAILWLVPAAQAQVGYCPQYSQIVKVVSTSTYTIGAADVCSMLVFTSATPTVTLPTIASPGLGLGFWVDVYQKGSGTLTFSGTLSGATNPTLASGRWTHIATDGTSLYAGSTSAVVAAATVAEGGTGAVSFTAHGVLLGEGTSAVTPTAAGTNGQLFMGSTGADPGWATTLTGAYTFSSASGQTFTGAITPTGGVAAAGGFSVSPRLVATCGVPALSATSSFTAQTPVTTEFYFAEVFVPANMTVTGVAVYNSGTISGNMKVGLANSAGANVATSGSVAMSGTTTYQLVPFSGTYAAVGPATYYVEVFYDNNTVRPNTFTSGNCGVSKATTQVYSTGFTTISAPTTFTTALGPVASLY